MRSTTRRLTLQALEDRRCPTGSIFQAGQTLIVRGDNLDNTIVIQDRGPGFQAGQAFTTLTSAIDPGVDTIFVASASGFPTSGNFVIQIEQEQILVVSGQDSNAWFVERGFGGTTASAHPSGASVSLLGTFTPATVTVTIDGQAQAFSNGVKRVVVFALGGNDSVSYLPDLAGGGTEGLRSLLVDLGTGNNVADFQLSRPTVATRVGPIPAVGLGLQVFGGAGADTVSVEVGELDAADVYVHARLGDGADTFIGAVAGPLNPTSPPVLANNLLFDVRGGAGADSIDLEAGGVTANGYDFRASLRGGAGDDNISADVELVGNVSSFVELTLDGGLGDDALSATVDNETRRTPYADSVHLMGGSGDDAMVEKFTVSGHGQNLITDGGAGTDSEILFFHVNAGASLNRIALFGNQTVEDLSPYTF